jgi:hypothetical protein
VLHLSPEGLSTFTADLPHRRTNHWRLCDILEAAPAPPATPADADGRAHFLMRVARPHPVWWQGVLSRGTLLHDLLGLAPLALGDSRHLESAFWAGVRVYRPPPCVALRLSRRRQGVAPLPRPIPPQVDKLARAELLGEQRGRAGRAARAATRAAKPEA